MEDGTLAMCNECSGWCTGESIRIVTICVIFCRTIKSPSGARYIRLNGNEWIDIIDCLGLQCCVACQFAGGISVLFTPHVFLSEK